jgi:hypothetical protein
MKLEVENLELKYLPFESLKPLQGNLKVVSEEDHLKLKQQILKKGFKIPFYIWHKVSTDEYFYMDGHTRRIVLKRMQDKDGYEIPNLPCVIIPAKDYQDAKETLLAITSHYGKATKEGVEEFLSDIDLSVEEFNDSFDLGVIDFQSLEPENNDQNDDEQNLSFDYKLEVDCNTEEKQQMLLMELQDREFKVRVLL